MIRKISVLIIMIILMSCTQTSTTEQTSYLIQPQQFKEMMSQEGIVVLDVRTPQEVAAGVIDQPTIINFRDEDFKDQILALDKSKTYLVYCKSGGRSGQTKSMMDEHGFKEVYDLKGGITAWKDAGFSIE